MRAKHMSLASHVFLPIYIAKNKIDLVCHECTKAKNIGSLSHFMTYLQECFDDLGMQAEVQAHDILGQFLILEEETTVAQVSINEYYMDVVPRIELDYTSCGDLKKNHHFHQHFMEQQDMAIVG